MAKNGIAGNSQGGPPVTLLEALCGQNGEAEGWLQERMASACDLPVQGAGLSGLESDFLIPRRLVTLEVFKLKFNAEVFIFSLKSWDNIAMGRENNEHAILVDLSKTWLD